MESANVIQAILVAGVTIAVYRWLSRFAHSQSAARLPAKHWSLEQTPARDEPIQSSGQNRGVYLRLVSPLDKDRSETETDTDIIAIHGLDTKSPDTWIWKKDPSNPKEDPRSPKEVNWLADAGMLPSRVGRARIFTCDWPADLRRSSFSVPTTLEQSALSLLDSIRGHLSANGQTNNQRILFIASCLGGIILIKALELEDSCGRDEVTNATRGVVFLGTPFRGTAFKDMPDIVLKAWASLQDQTVTALLDYAKGATPDLDKLVDSFTRRCLQRSYQVFTFSEDGKTILLRKFYLAWAFSNWMFLVWLAVLVSTWLLDLFSPWLLVLYFPWILGFRSFQPKQLVDGNSASLPGFHEWRRQLNRRHVQMNKFGNPKCPDYDCVARKIQEILGIIRKGTLLEQADTWIRDKYYTKEKLRIERLLYNPETGEGILPMENCYINLAIVEQPGENTHRSKDGSKNGSEGDAAPQSSPFSLSDRLKVETPEKELQIELPMLFNSRKMPEPRRILIRGCAGVGKTTLCKKIVYDFTYAKMWKTSFDRVLWVPLRKLKELSDREYNHRDLFNYIYFAGRPDKLCLAEGLWRAIDPEATNNPRTLFLLDGLDEVSELLDSAHRASDFLKILLNSPNAIITTRPHATLQTDIRKPDLELETIGFYQDHVQDYLQKVVQDPPKVKEIQSFLQKHWLVQSLVRIPIQLDALCLTWDKDFRDKDSKDKDFKDILETMTMTAIYKAIVQRLWKKDVQRLDKQSEHVTRKAYPPEINRHVKHEIKMLEHLAFSGLRSNVIEFQPAHREAIFKHFEYNEANISLDEMLERISFLRTSDPSAQMSRRNYHFLHLTFQEFFAAQYFARQWKAGKDLQGLQYLDFNSGKSKPCKTCPIEFLQQHKYTARYDIVWRFTAGLLEKDEVPGFFEAIEQKPLDLLGPTHQRLVMHCLSEVDSSTELPIRSDLEAKLSQWLLFECDLTGSSLLARESECPGQALRTALEEGSGLERVKILGALRHPGRHLSETTVAALTDLLKHEDEGGGVRYAAAKALGRQSTLPETTVVALTNLLKDEGEGGGVRYAAAKALWCQSTLPETTVAALIDLLKHKDESVQYAAAEALGCQSTLPETTIAALTDLLKHKDKGGYMQYAAARALGHQSTLPETTVMALIDLLKDGDAQSAAAEALGRQSTLPQTTIAALTDLLKHEDKDGRARSAVAEALRRQSNLLDKIIEALGLFLESERPHNTPNSTLCNPQFVESLYGSLLCRSFGEQFSLYIDDRNSSCIINQASGLRPASFDSSQDIRTAVDKGRQLWNIGGYKLWDKEDAQ